MVDFFLIDRTQPDLQAHPEGRDALIAEAVDDALRSSHAVYTKAVTGSVDASTVSDSQSSEYRRFLRAVLIKFTGTLSGSPAQITYTLPVVEKVFHFFNATNTDVLVRISAGSPDVGTVVRSGMLAQLYATGSNVVLLNEPDVMQFAESGSMDGAADLLLLWRSSSASLASILGNNLGLGGGGGGGPLTFRGALVYSSADFTISTGTSFGALSWDSESYDTDGWHSAGDPTKLVVPAGVTKVKLAANVHWDTSSTGMRAHIFRKNGAAFQGCGELARRGMLGGTNSIYNFRSAVVECSAGDYFTAEVWQNSGANRTISANGGFTTWFSVMAMES